MAVASMRKDESPTELDVHFTVLQRVLAECAASAVFAYKRMIIMRKNLFNRVLATAVIVSVIALGGCSTSKEEMLPPGDSSMLELWQGEDGGGSARNAVAARDSLRRPLTDIERQATAADDRSYSRTQESEISQQFPRLPNPDLVMYVFPHLADSNAPVPGYSTVFPFYSQVQYAMPGERTEAY